MKGLIQTAGVRESPHGFPELAPIANRALISYPLALLARHGIREAAVFGTPPVCASLRAAIGDDFRGEIGLTYIEQPDPRRSLDALRAVRSYAAGAALAVVPGDALVRVSLEEALRAAAAADVDVTLVAGARATASDGTEPLEARRLTRLIGQLAPEAVPRADTGVRVLGPRFFEALESEVPGRRRGELSGVLAALMADGGRVAVESAEDWWAFDGTLDGLLDGNRRVLDELTPRLDPASVRGSRVQGRANIHPTARIEDSTIRGPVVVGAGARIRSGYIGPYTAIGANVNIDGAEIENSILLPRARVEYVGRRIEASIVGSDARISRDFSLPKAVRLRIGDHAEVCLA